jgi:hypothetical protein
MGVDLSRPRGELNFSHNRLTLQNPCFSHGFPTILGHSMGVDLSRPRGELKFSHNRLALQNHCFSYGFPYVLAIQWGWTLAV